MSRAAPSSQPNLLSSPFNVVAVVVLIGLLVYMFGWSANFQEPAGPGDSLSGADYLQFFVAGQLVRRGQGNLLYDFDHVKAFQHDPKVIPYEWDPNVFGLCIYPPFFVWFCLPFSYLPYHAGAIVWASLMAGFFAAALAILLRSRPAGMCYFGWALLGCLLYRPLVMAIYTCQNATLSLLILTAAYLLMRRGRPVWAGLVFAALAFKPQLTLVISLAMLCKRQWRFVSGALAGGVVLLAASLAISPAATLDYLRLAPHMSKWIDMPGMPLERMSCWYGFWRLIFDGHPLVYAQSATVVASVATLVPLVYILRRPIAPQSPFFAVQFAALVLTTVILSPHLLSYDLTLLLLPMFLLCAPARTCSSPRLLTGPRLAAATLFLAASVSESVAAATGVQVIVPVMALTLAVLARRSPEPTSCPNPPACVAA